MSRYLTFLVILSICYVSSRATSNCEQTVSMTYLDAAVDMITKAKYNIPTSVHCGSNLTRLAMDCSDLFQMGYNRSGAYTIWPVSRVNNAKSLLVYCDMQTDGGGWTIIQRRGNFQNPADYFFRDWKSYKEGFGDIEKEFWLGNDNIFALTNQKPYSARFDLRDVENNTRYEHYDAFWIDDENCNYTLHISKGSGNAGDSLFAYHNWKFSTKDRDNDDDKGRHCAEQFKGGWWYNKCHYANLNGMNLRGKHKNSEQNGISWHSWKGHDESMDSTEIKIRPEKFIGLHHVPLNTPV